MPDPSVPIAVTPPPTAEELAAITAAIDAARRPSPAKDLRLVEDRGPDEDWVTAWRFSRRDF